MNRQTFPQSPLKRAKNHHQWLMFFHSQAAILAGKERAELEAAEKENTFHCTARDIGIEVGTGWCAGHIYLRMLAL